MDVLRVKILICFQNQRAVECDKSYLDNAWGREICVSRILSAGKKKGCLIKVTGEIRC